MLIALVGPTHPYKGGVAAHTTGTAHRLARLGHDVHLVSWSRLMPERLYPGEEVVPDGGPDLAPFPGTTRPLRWDRPGTWSRTGRSLSRYDLVVVVVVVPAQVPALLAVVRALRGRGPGGPGTGGPRVVVLAHNVVPHETHPGDRWLMSRMLRAADAVLVHSDEMAGQARERGARHVVVADLPPHLPGSVPDARELAARRTAAARRRAAGGPVRMLCLGMVRPYKGIDLLLEAARGVPGVEVTVAGEQWGDAGRRVRELAADPALAGRVDLRAGYVPAAEVTQLLARHDVVALPYRHATASQNVLLAHAHGLPVLATRVGTFPAQVRDGVDGLLVAPGDTAALAGALRGLLVPGALDALRAAVPEVDLDAPWTAYGAALVGAGATPPADGTLPGSRRPADDEPARERSA